jgi:hypothetical protein
MPARLVIAAERIAEGKILYEQTDTSVQEICIRMGISKNVLYARIDGWKWQRRRYSGASADAEASEAPPATARSTQTAAEDSAALEPPEVFYARVCRGVQRQMTIIERVQKTLLPASGAMQSERSARVLATINKALLEIEATAKPHKVPDEDDDPIPDDIEEFRAELARRIQGLVDAERRKSGEGAGSDPAE